MKELEVNSNSVMVAVAKESRHEIQYKERVGFHLETAKCQFRAFQFAKAFNQDVLADIEEGEEEDDFDIPEVKVLCCVLYRLKSSSHPGGYRYLAVENELKGTYQKWNNNDGYVNRSDCIDNEVAQAFRRVKVILSVHVIFLFHSCLTFHSKATTHMKGAIKRRWLLTFKVVGVPIQTHSCIVCRNCTVELIEVLSDLRSSLKLIRAMASVIC
jgi:hypothetical protein